MAIMKNTLYSLSVGLTLFAIVQQAPAQGTQFFRISGPATTTMTAFNPDGTLVWSNALTGTNYLVQTAPQLVGTNWVDYVQLPVANSVNTNQIVDFHPPAGMAFIPAGSFTMGNTSLDSDETDAKPTNVMVSAFYMDVYLVTYSQWQSLYNWAGTNGYTFAHAGLGKDTNHPVVNVDWFDAVKWCNARSQQAGLTPVYYTDAALTLVYTNGDSSGTAVYVNWANNGYRLPTEAEWEKAARGGLIGQRFPWGNTISESQANYYGDLANSYDLGPAGYNAAFVTKTTPYTSPVGYFAPNGYGLYDMAGNVFEWCWDWYGTPYGQPTTTNPTGVASGSDRVFRGGSWYFPSGDDRCFGRSGNVPTAIGQVAHLSFRCARGH
jgi:formylglycine-generating enzyme required for sulfatase activity